MRRASRRRIGPAALRVGLAALSFAFAATAFPAPSCQRIPTDGGPAIELAANRTRTECSVHVPPFCQLGFDRLEFDVRHGPRHTNLPLHLLDADDDRLLTTLSLASDEERAWRHVTVGRDEFTLWPMYGDHRPSWESVDGLTFTVTSTDPDAGPIQIARLTWFAHEGQVACDLLEEPGPGRETRVGDREVWVGPRLPMADDARDQLYLGSSHRQLLSDSGLLLAELLKKRFPGVALYFAGVGFPSPNAPFYLRKLWDRGVRYQMQKAGVNVPLLLAAERPFRNVHGTSRVDRSSEVLATDPLIQLDLAAEIENSARLGIDDFKQVDFIWPWLDGPWGYEEATLRAFRDDLRHEDEGLDLDDGSQGGSTVHFWDYFFDNRGVRFAPSELGLRSWSDYEPSTSIDDSSVRGRSGAIHSALIHYEFLRQAQRFGRLARSLGGRHSATLNPEDVTNGVDYVYLIRLASFGGPFIEYFGSPVNSEGPYYHQPTLSRAATRSGKRLGLLSELGAGGHGTPYKDPAMELVHIYDLTAAGHAAYQNEWLSDGHVSSISDPTNVLPYRRFMTWLAGAEGHLQARHDGAHRPRPRVVTTAQRSVLHSVRAWTWNRGDVDSFLSSLADAYVDVEETDPMGLRDILDSTRLLFHAAPFTPRQDVARLRRWLASGEPAEGMGRVLVTHSFVPIATDIGTATSVDDWVEALASPAEGDARGESLHAMFAGIRRSAAGATGRITAEHREFSALTALPASNAASLWELGIDDASTLVAIDGRPLLSEFRLGRGARVVYLHARPRDLSPAVAQAVVEGIVAYLGLPRLARAGPSPALAHVYTFDLGKVVVLYDRLTLEKWGFTSGYRDELAQSPYVMLQPGASGGVDLFVDEPGSYRIFHLVAGREQVVEVGDDRVVTLALKGQLGDVVYVAKDGGEWRSRIGTLRAEQSRRAAEWSGEARSRDGE